MKGSIDYVLRLVKVRTVAKMAKNLDSRNDPKIAVCDPTWVQMRDETEDMLRKTRILSSFLHATVLSHDRFENALSYHLAQKLSSESVSGLQLREVFDNALADDPKIGEAARADIVAIYDRDPACKTSVQPFLFHKGFHALQAYRMAHWLWTVEGSEPLAYFLQNRVSEVMGVDIHPASKMGRGIMIDHATAVVIGETAEVGDDVSILHGVKLGGTGKESGDRHPKIGRGVLISCGVKILGNLTIGECARIAAGSVVLKDVPPCKTVAGVPAKIVGDAGCDNPSHSMNQVLTGYDGEFDGSSI